jgi:uncharacterized protein with HEPN domain
VLVGDMLEAIADVESFVAGMDRATFATDRRTIHAVCRCLEIVGEAAGRLSAQACAAMDDIAWHQLRGVRNRIVHAYFDVDLAVVWTIATVDLPEVASRLRAHAPRLDPPPT